MRERIPKRIIQVWGQGERDLSLLSRAAMANVRLLHPDYEYLFFDDKSIDAFTSKYFPEYRGVFQSFQLPIQRYDFFRYLAVYRFGGFYLDLDVLLAANLDPLLSLECVFPFEELTVNTLLRRRYGMDWEVANYAFGAESGNPFLKAVIDNCVRAQVEPKWTAPMMESIPRLFRGDFRAFYSSGPGLVTRTLAENPGLADRVEVLFPGDVRDQSQWHNFGGFGVHLMRGSWIDRKRVLHRKMLRFWIEGRRRRLFRESQALGPARAPVRGAGPDTTPGD